MAAMTLRALGVSVFVMNDSKFDDYPRRMLREVVKRAHHLPYQGAIAAGPRSAEYMRFLGHRHHRIHLGYDSISTDRIRRLAADVEPPSFALRDFLVVARLVPKKNIATTIEAFAIFAQSDRHARKLRICGSGPLEGELKQLTSELGLSERVIFHGFEQIDVVARRMKSALALLLLSIEEQFGIVVGEALSLSVPVILSENVGARDELVRSGLNGFVVSPDNPTAVATFMRLLSEDADLHKALSANCEPFTRFADVGRFVRSVTSLSQTSS